MLLSPKYIYAHPNTWSNSDILAWWGVSISKNLDLLSYGFLEFWLNERRWLGSEDCLFKIIEHFTTVLNLRSDIFFFILGRLFFLLGRFYFFLNDRYFHFVIRFLLLYRSKILSLLLSKCRQFIVYYTRTCIFLTLISAMIMLTI